MGLKERQERQKAFADALLVKKYADIPEPWEPDTIWTAEDRQALTTFIENRHEYAALYSDCRGVYVVGDGPTARIERIFGRPRFSQARLNAAMLAMTLGGLQR